MPANQVERLAVLIEANTKSYERAMQRMAAKTSGAVNKSTKSIQRLDGKLTKLGKTLKSGVLSGVGIGSLSQLPAMIGGIVKEADKLGDTADKVGLTVTQLQELRFAGTQTGVVVTNLDVAMQRFSRRIGEAANGQGVLKDVLKDNNVQLRNQDGTMRSQNEILADYADLIKNAGSEQERLLLTFKAFDTEGAALVNTLKDGSEGLRRLQQDAHDAGAVLDEELVKNAGEVADEWDKITTRIETSFHSAVLGIIKDAGDATATLDSWIDSVAAFARKISPPDPMVSLRGGLLSLGFDENRKKFLESDQLGFGDFRGAGGASKDEAPGVPTIIPPAGGGSAEKQLDNFRKMAAALDLQVANLGRSSREQEIANGLARLGTEATDAQRAAIEAKIGMLHDMTAAQKQANELSQVFDQTIYSALESLIIQGEKAEDVMKRVVVQLAQAALQAALLNTGPLAGLFGGATGGGILTSIGKSLLPGFAGGGSVSGGKPIMVGERGPEVFVPQAAGQIIPNGKGAGSGGAVKVVIESSQYFDARVEEISGPISVSVSQSVVAEAAKGQQRQRLTHG